MLRNAQIVVLTLATVLFCSDAFALVTESTLCRRHKERLSTLKGSTGVVGDLQSRQSFFAVLNKLPDEYAGAPIYATIPNQNESFIPLSLSNENNQPARRLGLEAIMPCAFVVQDALSAHDCERIIQECQSKFERNESRENVAQLIVSPERAQWLSQVVSPHINLDDLADLDASMVSNETKLEDDDVRYTISGIDRFWKVIKYGPSLETSSAPHEIHKSRPPIGLVTDKIVLDTVPNGRDIRSRYTVLIFLNDDFTGGQEQFYAPKSEQDSFQPELLASLKPKIGSILVVPQVSDDTQAIHHAHQFWPQHVSSSVSGDTTRQKFVLQTDVLVETSRGLAEEDKGSRLFQFDALVRDTFLPRSPAVDDKFASQIASLYNPHMGVENAGPLLYSIVRFVKARKIVEIGAGFTSVWILQALKDNDDEMNRIGALQEKGKCRLLDYPWSVEENIEDYLENDSSLLCIDNCLHQRETATGAAAVAANLGLDKYFEFIQGDAYDMQFENESIDLLWCDFGVGNRMRDFAKGAWESIRPGGFLVCHSTLTNQGTRDWLEDVRARRDRSVTGIPPDEVVELSLLEPTKRYQNSLTILQRRKAGESNVHYSEPIYSLYA